MKVKDLILKLKSMEQRRTINMPEMPEILELLKLLEDGIDNKYVSPEDQIPYGIERVIENFKTLELTISG